MWRNKRKFILSIDESAGGESNSVFSPFKSICPTGKIMLRQVTKEKDALLFKCMYLFSKTDSTLLGNKSELNTDKENNKNVKLLNKEQYNKEQYNKEQYNGETMSRKNSIVTSELKELKELNNHQTKEITSTSRKKLKQNSTPTESKVKGNKEVKIKESNVKESKSMSILGSESKRCRTYAYDYEENASDFSQASFSIPVALTLPTFTDEEKYESDMAKLIRDSSSFSEFECPNLGKMMRESLKMPLSSLILTTLSSSISTAETNSPSISTTSHSTSTINPNPNTNTNINLNPKLNTDSTNTGDGDGEGEVANNEGNVINNEGDYKTDCKASSSEKNYKALYSLGYAEENENVFDKLQSFSINALDEKKLNVEGNLLHACIYISVTKPRELHSFYFAKLWHCFKNYVDKNAKLKRKKNYTLNILLKIMAICYSNYYYISESLSPINMFLEMFGIDCLFNECYDDIRIYLGDINPLTGKITNKIKN